MKNTQAIGPTVVCGVEILSVDNWVFHSVYGGEKSPVCL